jgi:hypothetical protein
MCSELLVIFDHLGNRADLDVTRNTQNSLRECTVSVGRIDSLYIRTVNFEEVDRALSPLDPASADPRFARSPARIRPPPLSSTGQQAASNTRRLAARIDDRGT